MIDSLNDVANNELLKAIIERLDAVVISDKNGRYVYVNNNWTELMGGVTLDEVKGLYVHDMVPETKVDEAIRTGKILTANDLTIRTKNGDVKMFCTYIPIFSEGSVVGCFTYTVFRGMDEAMNFVAQVNGLMNKVEYYKKELKEIRGAKYSINNIIGNSNAIKRVKSDIFKASRSLSNVLIEGETGSGKELVAHAIHDLSNRMDAPFIKINCAAIPGELLESEFFGYEYGAFSGAKKGGKEGKFEMANTGSIFLDEINHLPLVLQPKILRVLQEKEIEPLGGKTSVMIDTRVITASNVPLEKLDKENKFRSDLFYRLNVLVIKIPPLRERKEDIPLIADSLLDRLNFQMGMSVPGISDHAKQKLKEYDWPGNIRELQNVIERAMNTVWCDTIEWSHLSDYFENRQTIKQNPHTIRQDYEIKSLKRNMEKNIVCSAIEKCGGNKTEAAKMLGISRTMLYKKIRGYHLG
jgi:transcriptional regulator with PAS, ATPase and Fis domain